MPSQAKKHLDITPIILATTALIIHSQLSSEKKQKHDSALSGAQWFDELYYGGDAGNDTHFFRSMAMSQECFDHLFDFLSTHCGLADSRYITAIEQLAIWCYFVCTGAVNRDLQERFQRSGDTISKHVFFFDDLHNLT